MKITWKALLALFFYTLGVVGWFYVGGWMILRGPVRGVILAHMAGDLSLIKLAVALVQGFLQPDKKRTVRTPVPFAISQYLIAE